MSTGEEGQPAPLKRPNQDATLTWHAQEGERHEKMVKTAVWLVSRGGSFRALQDWVKRHCEDGQRTITDKEIRRVWNWAQEHGPRRTVSKSA